MASSNSFSLDLVLTVFGGLTVFWILLKAACGLVFRLRVYVLSEVWKGVDLASYGPWAVVTGATAGIGKAYAHELAKRGLNVVLISRSLEKLKQVAAEIARHFRNIIDEAETQMECNAAEKRGLCIFDSAVRRIVANMFIAEKGSGKTVRLPVTEERHGRSTRVIQMDFTEGSESYEPLRAALQGLEIGILVNNVGMGTSRPLCFLDYPDIDKFIPDMVNCNMLSMVKMTQIILPQMVARKKGIIINMSSVTARRPIFFLTLYSASKRFVDLFSRGLNLEYRSKGIIVQSVLPFFVETNMTTAVAKYFRTPADVFARKALNTVGLTSRTSGCLTHSIVVFLLESIYPEWLHLSPIGYIIISMSMKILLKQD